MSRATKQVQTCRRLITTIVIFAVVVTWFHKRLYTAGYYDGFPLSNEDITDHLADLDGAKSCGLLSSNLYLPPKSRSPPLPYCPTRRTLLAALSSGGRHGFDRPFFPLGCHYRWYSRVEICMILERFDGVVFVGDDMLADVYAAFNILLRGDAVLGGLNEWEMSIDERNLCKCGDQLRGGCRKHMVMESEMVNKAVLDGKGAKQYSCDRIPHLFIPITSSPATDAQRDRHTTFLGSSISYKPVPLVHSLGLGTLLSLPLATSSMDEWLTLSDSSGRSVPYLWVSPYAAGYLKPPNLLMSQGNSALWHFTVEMVKQAARRDVEALGMWNMTVQASSWDGTSYGLEVVLVQAMMIINWLARLETA